MKLGYIQRGLAVFFFIFSLTDLCCLGACCDEQLSPLEATAASLTDNTYEDSPVVSRDKNSEQEDDSKPCQGDECCFCCAHMVPGGQVGMAAIIIDSPGSEHYPTVLPKPPPRPLFHPPRIA